MSQHNAQASSSKHKTKKDKSKHSSSSKSDKSPFEHRLSRMRMSIPPKFAADAMIGVREKLDGMIMRYVSQMGGVLLAHWDHDFVDDTVQLINECPFGVIEVEFHAILWAPKIGQKLYGTHSLSSPSHLSLLFSKTFNVSIPLQHIPTDLYEFEHTDEAADSDSEDEGEDEDEVGGFGIDGGVEEVGRWKEKATGKALGEAGKGIKFTVIGMQVTNQMLSLTGSLLSDPSNPPAMPEAVAAPIRPSPSPSPEPASRPAKQPRVVAKPKPRQQAQRVEEEVDTSLMTARELKAYHKEQARKKRDERKARKGERAGDEDDAEEDSGAIPVPGEDATGVKRKAGEAGEEQGEKRKKSKKV
ncbi:hypothetical protein IAU60_000520 [Kwoniella sp. DSM 27419]